MPRRLPAADQLAAGRRGRATARRTRDRIGSARSDL